LQTSRKISSALRSGPLHLSAVALHGLFGLCVAGTLLYVGFQLGTHSGPPAVVGYSSDDLQRKLREHRERLDDTASVADPQLDTMAARLGRLQARLIRLEALGLHIADTVGIERDEIDFSREPPQGGFASPEEEVSLSMLEFRRLLDELSGKVDNRDLQLRALETIVGARRLRGQSSPAGRPIKAGWLSSGYGARVHPISGKKHFHHGVDFAGRAGSAVVAVASGVVTWSGTKRGYGKVLEVSHGSGLVTRYGHNREHLVKPGDTVRQGQEIALMGSTGKSTGPHVHFEVRRNGRSVNPTRFLRASRQ